MTHELSRRSPRTALSLMCAAGAFLAAASAFAQDGGTPDGGAASGPCDPTTYLCSSAMIKQKSESNTRLPIGIDTGWVPKCSPTTSNGHCSGEKVQIDAQIALDPVGENPIWVVDMPKGSAISVSWPDTSAFVVQLEKDAQQDGTFRLTHTLTPDFGLYLDAGSIFTGEIHIDANQLINLLPGAQFNYTALGSGKFNPWGFDGCTVNVKGTDLANSELFAVTFDQLGQLVGSGGFNGVVTGSFSFDATTDIDFTYQTTQVKVIGGTGSITQQDGTTQFPMQDQDYLEFTEQTSGEIGYTGTLDLKPAINITSIAGFSISLSFPINVGLSIPVQGAAIPVTFPTELVHLPLPNVFVPSSFVDFGQVDTGNKADKTVTIDNTGELSALLAFSSSDPQFSPSSASTQMNPGDSYDLGIRFKPTKSGKQQATITVTSNDPDSPVQTFDVYGYGVGQDLPGAGGAGGQGGSGGSAGAGTGGATNGADSTTASGCGCRTAGDSGSSHSALALLALGAVALIRRRRS